MSCRPFRVCAAMANNLHDDLLDVAAQLARLDTARPRQATLRRAVSSAYYALFHALAYLCADGLVGYSKSWEYFTPIYRSLDHGKAKNVLEALRRARGGDFVLIAQIFVELQREREKADYDLEYRTGRLETLDLIERARTAIERVKMLSPDDKLRLATQLIQKTRTK